ncbi:MAG TPA: RibD family protein, partial [bacterium]|nr:RibD family protein [bacterium]
SLKWAMSIDGKIANEKGQSQWITSDEARRYNKKIRFEYDAILTGINTILKDNSLFNYSVPGYAVKKQLLNHKRYYKILLDSYLRVPPSSNFFSPPTRLIIFTKKGINLKNRQYGNNVDIVEVNETQPGLLDITEVIRYLYNIGVGKLFVEGGTKILTSFYNLTLFDKIYMFMGTKIIGGDAVYPPVKGHLIPLDSTSFLSIKNVIRFSNDILIVLKNVLGNN